MSRVKFVSTVLLLALSTVVGYRLPTVYSPSYYSISLVLPPAIFTTQNSSSYTGTVEITFTSSENVSQIVLHASAAYINVTSATLVSGSASYSISGYSVNSTTDIFTAVLESALVVSQEYVLTLNFDGKVSTTDMNGLYKSSYTDANTTSYLVTTQMEPTYARRAFPCFDEPSYKANFSVSLTYPTGVKALGNMGILSSSSTIGTTTTKFYTTPVMSTYLVAFTLSEFTCTSGSLIEETLVNQVCSRNETSLTREFALEVAPRVIDSTNSYLNMNYSLRMSKLDQVAIPDFSSGAMENWGLITYRERALLYDANETSNAIQQIIAAVIAHELSHQWFGNLVTCKWWSEIFLNEGFATFFEYYTTHEIYPNYEMDKQFVIKSLQYVFEEDTSSTEALRTNATTPSEISARFGTISYEKGGSVLRMVEHIMGTENWKTGLNSYLTQLAHSSAEPEDLWRILGSYVKTTLPADNLTVVMTNWIDSPGYPVVNVSLNGTVLTFAQKRFVFNTTIDTNTTWYIPITYTTSENISAFQNTSPVAWLNPSASLTLNVSSNLSWIVVNTLQTGYYRVNYDSALWASLATALQQPGFSGIPEINRAQIVNDAFNLARGGYITYSQLFSIVQFLSSETSYTVWYPALSGFEYLLKRVGENSTLGLAIATHVLNLTSTLIDSVPITSTNASNHIYTLNQVRAQTIACKLGNSNCTTEAVRLFEEYKNTSTRPDKNLRSIVYCYGLKQSSNSSNDWTFLWNAFLNTSLSTEQVTIIAALGCTTNTIILNSYLQKTLTDNSSIRSQDYAAVFAAVYRGSTVGVDTALDFFISNYDDIISRYTGLNGVGNILKGIADQITTDAQISKLQSLIFSNVVNGTILEAANTALTLAQNNYQWVKTYRSSLNSYYGLDNDTTPSSNVTTTAPGTTTEGNSAHRLCISLGLLILGLIVILS